MQTYFSVGIESDQAFTEFLCATDQFNHKILAAAINAYLKTKIEYAKSYPQVKQTLKKLQTQGILLSIVTDAPKTKAYQRLFLMGIEHYFKFVVGYEDTQKPKQTGLPLQLAIKQLKKEIPGIHESEVLMVGDSINRDLTPAKQLGLKTVLALYGPVTEEDDEPDYELDDIRDLTKITQTYNNLTQAQTPKK